MVALPCAFLLKRFQGAPAEDAQRHKDLAFSGTVYEIALVVMSAYMAYLTAEVSLQPSCSASPGDLQGTDGLRQRLAASSNALPDALGGVNPCGLSQR